MKSELIEMQCFTEDSKKETLAKRYFIYGTISISLCVQKSV